MALIRRFRMDDAAASHAVFAEAVTIGAARRYSAAERRAWMPDPAMPGDWGDWLDGHFTLVAEEGPRLTGFFMIEASGYLNMAFVTPDRMGTGLAGRLYDGILAHARATGMQVMTTLTSRYAAGFFRRRGWVPASDLTEIPGLEPAELADALTMAQPMRIMLA